MSWRTPPAGALSPATRLVRSSEYCCGRHYSSVKHHFWVQLLSSTREKRYRNFISCSWWVTEWVTEHLEILLVKESSIYRAAIRQGTFYSASPFNNRRGHRSSQPPQGKQTLLLKTLQKLRICKKVMLHLTLSRSPLIEEESWLMWLYPSHHTQESAHPILTDLNIWPLCWHVKGIMRTSGTQSVSQQVLPVEQCPWPPSQSWHRKLQGRESWSFSCSCRTQEESLPTHSLWLPCHWQERKEWCNLQAAQLCPVHNVNGFFKCFICHKVAFLSKQHPRLRLLKFHFLTTISLSVLITRVH